MSNNHRDFQLKNVRSLYRLVMGMGATALAVLVIVGIEALNYMEERARSDTLQAAQTTNTALAAALELWLELRSEALIHLAQDAELRITLRPVLMSSDTLSPDSPEAIALKQAAMLTLRPLGFDALAIVDVDRKPVLSFGMGDEEERLLASQEGRQQLARVQQEKVVVLHTSGEQSREGVGHARIYMGTAMRSANGDFLGTLVARVPANVVLDPIVRAGRFGRTGESYAVDKNGHLLTQSRFVDAAIGISAQPPADASASHRQTSRLTLAAESVTQKNNGGSDTAYPDYRGVLVMRAWRWIDALDVGLITEIDEDEALEAFKRSYSAFMAVTAVVTLFIVCLFALLHYASRRQRELLEQQVQERTLELYKMQSASQELRDKYDLVLNEAQIGIVELDEQGCVVHCNRAGAELLGHEVDSLLGQDFHQIAHHSHADGSPFPRRDCPMLHATLVGEHYTVDDEVMWRSNGTPFDVTYEASPIIQDGQAVGAMIVFQDISARLAAQRELARREEEVSRIIDMAPDPMLVIDEDGIIIRANHRTAIVFGYDHDELIGQSVDLLVPTDTQPGHPNLRNRFVSQVQSLTSQEMRERTLWGREVAGRRKDGSRVDVEIALCAIPHEDSVRVITAARDITERKQAEAKLAASEDQYRRLVQTIPGTVYCCLLDEHWTMLYMSDEAERLTGFRADELINNAVCSYADLIAPEDTERVDQAIQLAAQEHRSYTIEYRLNTRDGGVKTVLERGIAVRKQDGEVAELIGTIIDISDRKAAEDALRESRERLSTATLAGNLAMWEYYVESDSLAVTPELFSMRGYDPSEFMSDPRPGEWGQLPGDLTLWHEMIHPDDLSAYHDAVNEHFKHETALFQKEYRVRCADGGYRWMLDTGRAVERDERGKPIRAVGVITDIDSLKRLQLQYEQAKAEAEAATQAKSDFLAKVTHEIRTPMNALMGLLKLARRAPEREQIDGYLTTADRSVDYMVRIINDILDFSKIEAGKMELEHLGFNLAEALEHSQDLLQSKSNERDVELITRIDQQCPLNLVGDPYRLEQIVINLVNNAIKFSDPGSQVIVDVSFIDSVDDDIKLKFAVSDTGIGLTPEEQARLFTSYQQASSSVARTHGGTGLGLSICQQLTELMGGEIWVESEKGRGSTFYFTASFGRAGNNDPQPTAESTTPTLLEGLRLLLAEDNPDNQDVVRELLEMEGIVVTTANNGAEALEAAQKSRFDLILMDCQMPVMNGYEAARAIKAEPSIATVPIIAMTGNTSEADIEAATAAGMVDHIAKPIDPDALLVAIGRWAVSAG